MCWSTWLSFWTVSVCILGSLSLSLVCGRPFELRDGNLNSIEYSDRKLLLITVYGKPFVNSLFVKGEDHSKKPDVLSLPIARIHSAFPLTEVFSLLSVCYAEEIRLEKEAKIKFDFG